MPRSKAAMRKQALRAARLSPAPVDSISSSSEQDSGSEVSASEQNTVWINSTITQLGALKDFISKAAATVDSLLTSLKGVSDSPYLSPSTKEISTMTESHAGTAVHPVFQLECGTSVSEPQRASSYDVGSLTTSAKKTRRIP